MELVGRDRQLPEQEPLDKDMQAERHHLLVVIERMVVVVVPVQLV